MKSIALRVAKRSDLRKICEGHDEQNERDGTNYPLPKLFDENGDNASHIPVVLVVERNGEEVIGSLYCQEVPELCFAGCNPQATAVARQDIEALAWALRQHGFTHLRTLVPEVVVDNIRKPLIKAGFVERRDLVVFTRSLEPRKEVEDESGSAESNISDSDRTERD